MFKTTSARTTEVYMSLISEPRKTEIEKVDAFIRKTVPKLKPFMISGMIGYGPYRYKSKSGKEGEWAIILLANQKNYISIYACGMSDGAYVAEKYKAELPKADVGKSCIRFKKLDDLDPVVLRKILLESEASPMGQAT